MNIIAYQQTLLKLSLKEACVPDVSPVILYDISVTEATTNSLVNVHFSSLSETGNT